MTMLRDYKCDECKDKFAFLSHPSVTSDPAVCACGSTAVTAQVGILSDPGVIRKGNHDFAARQRERLTKRSTEHFQHGGGHEEAIERQRAQFRREGYVS